MTASLRAFLRRSGWGLLLVTSWAALSAHDFLPHLVSSAAAIDEVDPADIAGSSDDDGENSGPIERLPPATSLQQPVLEPDRDLADEPPQPEVEVPEMPSEPEEGIAKNAQQPTVANSSDAVQSPGDEAAENPPADEPEWFEERFSNGAVHIKREVIYDSANRPINHGLYIEFDKNGQELRRGRYEHGLLQGAWIRRFELAEGNRLGKVGLNEFKPPFVTEAEFVDGQLHGCWLVSTKTGRKIVEWQFQRGVLDGQATWYFPNGNKRREVTYKQGLMVGELTDWSADKKETSRISCVDGRILAPVTEWHAPGQKMSEGTYLLGLDENDMTFDWWTLTAKVTPVGKKAPPQKTGEWTFWHRNGQKKLVMEYLDGQPLGKTASWYENGQPQAEGTYVDGRPNGFWVTWHANGQKASQGEYLAGKKTGPWLEWKADGTMISGRNVADLEWSDAAFAGSNSSARRQATPAQPNSAR